MSDFKITDKNGIKLKTANKYVMEDLAVTLTDDDINNIVAENIRKGKTILNIPGSLEEGIDTSDATAISSDILVGKTAYANNEKIDGTMSEYDGTFENGEDNTQEDGLITRTLSGDYSNDRVTKISDYVFYYCKSLTSGSFPNATIIGNNAFNSCSNLTSISLPQATKISSYAFYSCSNLTSINLPQATSIGSYAFYSCKSLTSVDMPNVTSIDHDSFTKCSNLTSISLPQATSISSYVFSGCSNLTSVDIPNVTSINNAAFQSCYSLLKLVITQTDSVCTLATTNAFERCYHFLGTVNSQYNPTGAKDGRIYVPDELVDSYKSATNWSQYADIIVGLSELPAEE